MAAEPQLGHSRASARIVWAAIALHAALTAVMALARFASVHNRTFDLALYARMAWGLVHGEAWDPIVGGSFLGGHLPLVLLPLGALGQLLGTVPVLLVTQSIALALTAWPLSLIGARQLGPAGGIAAALAYLLYPNLGHVATYEFHPGALGLLPMAYALEWLERPVSSARPRGLIGFCAAVVACRVSLALQTALIALLARGRSQEWRRACTALLIGSVAYFGLSLVLQARFGAGIAASADLHYGQWGGSPFGVLGALVRAPGLVIEHFLPWQRWGYPLRVLAPLAFLPLLAPRYLLVALPPIALNLLSAFPTAQGLYSHYLTPALPPLVAAAVLGAAELSTRAQPCGLATRARAFAPWLLAGAAAAGCILAGGLPFSLDFDASEFRGGATTRARRAAIARIGPEASVQAPDPLLPHLAERTFVHRAPPPEREARFVAFDISHRVRFAGQSSLLRTIEEPVVRSWLARPDHRVVFADRELLVLERGASPRGGLVARYFAGIAPAGDGRELTHCLALRSAELDRLDLRLEFVASAPCPPDLAIRFGAEPTPERVDLLFDGVLSPAHVDRGDLMRSTHRLSREERATLLTRELYVGAVRASGARPRPSDPISVPIRLKVVR
jgi:uncharacterized membrane protein